MFKRLKLAALFFFFTFSGMSVADNAELSVAAELGSLERVRELLRAGHHPNLFGHDFNSPLTLAIEKRHFQIVTLLMENGADPWAQSRRDAVDGEPLPAFLALLNGVFGGEAERIAVYMAKHLNPPVLADGPAFTWVHAATMSRSQEVLKIVATRASAEDLERKDERGRSPIDLANWDGRPDLQRILESEISKKLASGLVKTSSD